MRFGQVAQLPARKRQRERDREIGIDPDCNFDSDFDSVSVCDWLPRSAGGGSVVVGSVSPL